MLRAKRRKRKRFQPRRRAHPDKRPASTSARATPSRRGTRRCGRRPRAPAFPGGCSGAPPRSPRPRRAGSRSSTPAPDRRRGGSIRIVEPDLDRDQQALRRADLEFVESDVRLDRERIEQDPRRADLEVVRDQAGRASGQSSLMHLPRNCTSRSRRQEALAAIDRQHLAGHAASRRSR